MADLLPACFFPFAQFSDIFNFVSIVGSILDRFGMFFGMPGNLENGAPVNTGARFSRCIELVGNLTI